MGIVVANISIDFIHEITAGQLIEIRGAWIRVGGKSLTHEQRMFEADSGTLCAVVNAVLGSVPEHSPIPEYCGSRGSG